jgi:hypothetical protein
MEEKLLHVWAVDEKFVYSPFSAARSYLIQACTACVTTKFVFSPFGGSVECYPLFVL